MAPYHAHDSFILGTKPRDQPVGNTREKCRKVCGIGAVRDDAGERDTRRRSRVDVGKLISGLGARPAQTSYAPRRYARSFCGISGVPSVTACRRITDEEIQLVARYRIGIKQHGIVALPPEDGRTHVRAAEELRESRQTIDDAGPPPHRPIGKRMARCVQQFRATSSARRRRSASRLPRSRHCRSRGNVSTPPRRPVSTARSSRDRGMPAPVQPPVPLRRADPQAPRNARSYPVA